jgi:hypothetical protein
MGLDVSHWQIADATPEELEKRSNRRTMDYPSAATLDLLKALQGGTVKKVQFATKEEKRSQYMRFARLAHSRGIKIESFPDKDDPLICYIRLRQDQPEKAKRPYRKRTRGQDE